MVLLAFSRILMIMVVYNYSRIFLNLTFPVGNFARNSLELLVSPNTNLSQTLIDAPENSAAINALKALKLSG